MQASSTAVALAARKSLHALLDLLAVYIYVGGRRQGDEGCLTIQRPDNENEPPASSTSPAKYGNSRFRWTLEAFLFPGTREHTNWPEGIEYHAALLCR
jgi:hypothetical protein